MKKEEAKIVISAYKSLILELQKKIRAIENEIKEDDDSLNNDDQLSLDTETNFYNFLTRVKKLSSNTASNYFTCLRGIKIKLEKYKDYKLDEEIYNIRDLKLLLMIRDEYKSCVQLLEDNKKRHNAFSAALNNYITFIRYCSGDLNNESSNGLIFDD